VKEDEMARACSMNGEKRHAYSILVGKPEGKRPLGRPIHRCENNVNMDLRQLKWRGVGCIHLVQERNQ
jgi:hypothetical protein